MALPTATSYALDNPRCLSNLRWAETPEDRALVDAGWSLFGPYQSGWDLSVVYAASGYDAMCRPVAFNAFVFQGGVFAGTVSPSAMNSRSSGSGTVATIRRDGLSARFLRYADMDALCCPSLGAVNVTYAVESTPLGPVLVPTQVSEERAARA